MIIALTALKEKIRRKELYVVSAIGAVILLVFGTGSGSLSINGQPVTDYRMLAPVLLIVVNAISCILAVIMSLGTIPAEYERSTSHLVWIRKIPQYRYHGELALANIFSGLISEAILFVPMFIIMIINGRAGEFLQLAAAYLIIGLNVTIVCAMTSALSIVITKSAAGAIAAAAALAGIFSDLLATLKDIIGGFGGVMVKYFLKIIPNLHRIQNEAADALCGKNVDIHIILTGLLAVYVFAVMIFVLRRKEA